MEGKVDTDMKIDEVEVIDEDVMVKKVDPREEDQDDILEKEKEVHYASRIFGTIFVTVEVFLFLKFLLEFLEANPDSVFFSFVLFVTAPFMFPFERLFTQISVSGYEINTLFAMFFYMILAVVIRQIIRLFRPIEGDQS